MSRRSFSRKERVRLFTLYAGECYLCAGKIAIGDAWEIEHVIAWELTRDDEDGNLRLAHVKCHKVKTAGDIRIIRKSDRVHANHIGAFKPSTRGFRKPTDTIYDWRQHRYVRISSGDDRDAQDAVERRGK